VRNGEATHPTAALGAMSREKRDIMADASMRRSSRRMHLVWVVWVANRSHTAAWGSSRSASGPRLAPPPRLPCALRRSAAARSAIIVHNSSRDVWLRFYVVRV
jgi:hypothetical protein